MFNARYSWYWVGVARIKLSLDRQSIQLSKQTLNKSDSEGGSRINYSSAAVTNSSRFQTRTYSTVISF